MLLQNGKTDGYMCPGCYVFSRNPNEISRHDSTCSNCHEYFIMPVTIIPLRGTVRLKVHEINFINNTISFKVPHEIMKTATWSEGYIDIDLSEICNIE